MDKELLQYLGANGKEVVTNYGDIDSEKLLDDEYKILNVKVFSVGLLDNETINKLNTQSTDYKKFINLKEVELEALKNNDELLSETDLVLLIGEYEDTKAMAKLEYIIQNAGLRDIKTVLMLSVNNNIDNDLIREISTKVDVLVPIIDNKVQHYAQNAFSFLDKNNLKAELAQQYINTILEFAPERISVIAPIDIIDIFTHNKGIAYVSSASATGEGRAERAAALALSNIYSLKDYKDCKILLLTFSGAESLGLIEINDAAQVIVDKYSDEETILFTVGLDESMGSEMRVSVMGI
ncbi:hypothetical protein [Clostridium tagluense]|uniref:hypothetical protein n=1 Tax=Clostridium tagluense TaxID=360422 RepID=UPI001C6F4A5C|nr:hypothetical protein [Clostridium tagluense]MBW9158739.1 hypothetical protein [Clostridium tagluense]WLC67390.1 hypothetical protein KTC93_09525 [Clostridium tagluense]